MEHVLPIMAAQGLVIAAIALGSAWLTDRIFGDSRRDKRRGQFIGPGPGSARWCVPLIVGLVMGATMHSGCPLIGADPIFTGGQTEQHAINTLAAQQAVERKELLDTGVTYIAVKELDQRHAQAMGPLIEQHAAAVARHHDATRRLTLWVGALLLLLAGAAKPGRLGDALPVALGAGFAIALAAFGAAWLLIARDWIFGAVLLIAGCCAAALPIGERYLTAMTDDNEGPALVTSVAWWLLSFALAIAVGLHPKLSPNFYLMGVFLVLTLIGRALGTILAHPAWRLIAALALGAAWLSPAHGNLIGAGWIVGQVLIDSNINLRPLHRLIGPIIALLIGMSVNVVVGISPWLLLAALIIMYDARALGVWGVTRLLGGRRGLRYGAVLAIAGPTTLVVAWMLHDLQVIDVTIYSSLLLAAGISGLFGGAGLRLLNISTSPQRTA